MVNPAEVDAVVLVGGMGTRLRPLTLSAPKPMLPTAGLPFLTHLLSRIDDQSLAAVWLAHRVFLARPVRLYGSTLRFWAARFRSV